MHEALTFEAPICTFYARRQYFCLLCDFPSVVPDFLRFRGWTVDCLEPGQLLLLRLELPILLVLTLGLVMRVLRLKSLHKVYVYASASALNFSIRLFSRMHFEFEIY